MMDEWGVLGWKFGFDWAKKRFGCCNFTERKITISRKLTELNDEKAVRDTILHEIAHALCGRKIGHGKEWKKMCAEIGGRPERCFQNDVKVPKGKWTAKCPACLKEWQVARKRKGACKDCCKKFGKGKFDRRFEIVFELNEKKGGVKKDGLVRMG